VLGELAFNKINPDVPLSFEIPDSEEVTSLRSLARIDGDGQQDVGVETSAATPAAAVQAQRTANEQENADEEEVDEDPDAPVTGQDFDAHFLRDDEEDELQPLAPLPLAADEELSEFSVAPPR
ncbi:hypothetical protein HK405_014813, partial [Cladochytrium tenue]